MNSKGDGGARMSAAVPGGPLRVAIVSSCAVATPPKAYGGTELVLADLARGLLDLGHMPTVFATGDSTCPSARGGTFATPVWPPDDLAELRHASAAWGEIARAREYDVVHVNQSEALPFSRFVRVPTVATVHHDRVEAVVHHYASYPEVGFAAISERQATLSPDVPFRRVIHHGLCADRYPYGEGGEDCVYLGRFAEVKGTHLAIDAARAAGARIALAGAPHPPERAYFEREVAPRLGPDAAWVGELGPAKKVALLQTSRCLLFPIQWEEPFGLVMIEAMLVGTPVIAFARGAAPEVVDEGVTGFVVDSVEEMTMRIDWVRQLDRKRCRARAFERFGASRMAQEYVALYRDVMGRDAMARAQPSPARPQVRGGPDAGFPSR